MGQNMDKLCCDTMPQPMWEGHADTAFAWSNAAYDALCRRFGRAYVQAKFAAAAGDVAQRVSLEGSDGDEACYEVTTLVSQERTLCQAYDVTALVQAERAQRSGAVANRVNREVPWSIAGAINPI